jgi:hypothetical protein
VVKEIEKDKNIDDERRTLDAAVRTMNENVHPKAIFEHFQNNPTEENAPPPVGSTLPPRTEFVTPPTDKTMLVEKYLIVNGFDRDWHQNKNRFRVVADFNAHAENDLHERYRNIRSIALKRVIIPQEIQEAPSVGNAYRPNFNQPFNFAYPYVIVSIDEISDVYDGTNDAVRRSFCTMIIDKHWKCRNGRGFLVLVCMQDEKKVFYPSALSRLSRLSMTVRKPNGDIFNTSKDDYSLFKVEYESYNPHYLKIVVHKYFDKNEFYQGDNVKFKGVSSSSGEFADFLNRVSGHEIMEMGQPNASGFYKTFYIHAPGAFDAESGRFVVDLESIQQHELFNEGIDFTDTCYTNGDVMNTTLQCVFTFKLEEIVADPGTFTLSV